MKWLFNIFKPRIGKKSVPMVRFGSIDTRTGELSDGYITSNGKMAYRRVGKWSAVNRKMAP
jgi:hypothetical protein